jgi:hypothetical protein
MNKPPKSPPHSDISGVHEDERRNVDAANEAGQNTEDLELARKEAVGRPPHSDPGSSNDNRTED